MVFQMAEVVVPKALFGEILERIGRLRVSQNVRGQDDGQQSENPYHGEEIAGRGASKKNPKAGFPADWRVLQLLWYVCWPC